MLVLNTMLMIVLDDFIVEAWTELVIRFVATSVDSNT